MGLAGERVGLVENYKKKIRSAYIFYYYRMIDRESAVYREACLECRVGGDKGEGEELGFLKLSKSQFSTWALKLPTEERYLALRVRIPELIETFRHCSRIFGQEWQMVSQKQVKNSQQKLAHVSIYQNFIDSIVFQSQYSYLDCLGFQFSLIQQPDRIIDLLQSIKNISITSIPPHKPSKTLQKIHPTKSQWIHQAVSKVQLNLIKKMHSTWNPKKIQIEKQQKKQFRAFWKSLTEDEKINNLYLGNTNLKSLVLELIDLSIDIKPSELQLQISEILTFDKKDFWNKIFKWKCRRNSSGLCDYFSLLFMKLKASFQDKKFKGEKVRKFGKKKKNWNRRPKSLGASSNETNETEVKQSKLDFDIPSYIQNVLENDFEISVDNISQQANQYFPSRVLAYQRLNYILQLCGIQSCLYGSCASGIAIKNSDIDCALKENILDWYQYLSNPHEKINAVFQMLEFYFKSFKWITKIKKIPNAYIPIMKFTIQTQIPFELHSTPAQTINYLNRTIPTKYSVQIDLTIQTTLQKTGIQHLGIMSTSQSLYWMSVFPSLRQILIMLKNKLHEKGLNETYYGGINTYTLMIMIVGFLVTFGLEFETCTSLVFEKMLVFYGWQFDESLTAIDLSGYMLVCQGKTQNFKGAFINKNQKILNNDKYSRTSALLEIHDPLNNGKIMTKNCYRYHQIKAIFHEIYHTTFYKSRKDMLAMFEDKEKNYNCSNCFVEDEFNNY